MSWMVTCPSCPAGEQARKDVLDHDFGPTLGVTLVPFLVIGAICHRLHRRRIP